MNNADTAIEFHDVSFTLPDGKTLLSNLNLQVHEGETLVLLGRSGSGKTTTMKLINRLIDPTAGEVRVEQRPTVVWDPIRLRRRIGYVIQEVGLFPHLTVEENIGVVPRLEGWTPERVRARAHTLLSLVGLDPERFAGRFPRALSRGQRQRSGAGRACGRWSDGTQGVSRGVFPANSRGDTPNGSAGRALLPPTRRSFCSMSR